MSDFICEFQNYVIIVKTILIAYFAYRSHAYMIIIFKKNYRIGDDLTQDLANHQIF